MHTFVCRIASITLTLLLAAGTARAGEVYVQTNLVSNNQRHRAPSRPTRTCRVPGGCPSQPAAHSGLQPGVRGRRRCSVTRRRTPASIRSLLVVTITNQGSAPPSEPAMTNGPTGQVNTGAPGITTGSTDFLVGTVQGRLHFRQYGRLDFGVERGLPIDDRWRPSPAPRSPGWRSATCPTAVPPRYTPPTRTEATSTSSIASWQMTGRCTDPNLRSSQPAIAAFNVQNLDQWDTDLFVTYANQTTSGGIVDEYKHEWHLHQDD